MPEQALEHADVSEECSSSEVLLGREEDRWVDHGYPNDKFPRLLRLGHSGRDHNLLHHHGLTGNLHLLDYLLLHHHGLSGDFHLLDYLLLHHHGLYRGLPPP